MKLALGARRSRLIRELLTESLLLASFGGAAGLIVALWSKDFWKIVKPADTFYAVTIDSSLNLRVLGFAIGLSLVTGIIFGLAPAFDASRLELVQSLKLEARGSKRERRFNLRSMLVVAQVALSFMLLIGSMSAMTQTASSLRLSTPVCTGTTAPKASSFTPTCSSACAQFPV